MGNGLCGTGPPFQNTPCAAMRPDLAVFGSLSFGVRNFLCYLFNVGIRRMKSWGSFWGLVPAARA